MNNMEVIRSAPTLLIVEDDESLLDLYRDAFSETIFDIVFAKDIVEAISKINNQKFYCVIFDLQLKNKTSEKLISSVKRKKHHINFKTPFLLVSGQLEGPIVTSLAPFVEKIILKPFSIKYLLQEVQLLVELENIALRDSSRDLVLVVEDEEQSREIMCTSLNEAGFNAVGASNHLAAHKLVQMERYSCILIDLDLDGVDGQSIILGVRLQSDQINRDTPFIVMSDELTESEINDFLTMANDVLLKPFSPAQLVSKVHKVIADQKTAVNKKRGA